MISSEKRKGKKEKVTTKLQSWFYFYFIDLYIYNTLHANKDTFPYSNVEKKETNFGAARARDLWRKIIITK